MLATAFYLSNSFFDYQTGDRLPDDFKGYVVDYTARAAKANDSIGAPVFETALNGQRERVWVFVDWER